MPLYEYECEACGNRFERIRKFSDPPLDEPCSSCGGVIKKLISSPAIQFKGAGWYVNDYAKPGTKSESTTTSEASADAKSDANKKSKDSSSDSGSESKADTTSEAKPDTKPEAKSETKSDAPKPAAPAASKKD